MTELVTTDTVPHTHATELPNLHVRFVAPLMAEAIRRIHCGESVSSLFTSPEWTTDVDGAARIRL